MTKNQKKEEKDARLTDICDYLKAKSGVWINTAQIAKALNRSGHGIKLDTKPAPENVERKKGRGKSVMLRWNPPAPPKKPMTNRDRLLDWVRTHPGHRTSHVMRETAIKQGSFSQAIIYLEKNGLIERDKTGATFIIYPVDVPTDPDWDGYANPEMVSDIYPAMREMKKHASKKRKVKKAAAPKESELCTQHDSETTEDDSKNIWEQSGFEVTEPRKAPSNGVQVIDHDGLIEDLSKLAQSAQTRDEGPYTLLQLKERREWLAGQMELVDSAITAEEEVEEAKTMLEAARARRDDIQNGIIDLHEKPRLQSNAGKPMTEKELDA